MAKVLTDSTALRIQELLRRPTGESRPRGRDPVMVPVAKCGALIGDNPRPHYFATLYWVPDLDGPINAPGSTEDTTILADLNGAELEPGRFYHVVVSGTDEDDEGNPLSLLWAGDAADTSSGSAWPAALRQEHCLTVSFISGDGACDCAHTFTPFTITSGDGLTWTSGITFNWCGVNYTLSFMKEGCDGPCATITSVSGRPCCEEGGESEVEMTVIVVDGEDETECTATLTRAGGVWVGNLTCGGDEEPPGDDCAGAGALPLGATFSDTFPGSGQQWWFSFSVTNGLTYKVTITRSGSFPFSTVVSSGTCESLSTVTTLSNSGCVDFTAPYTGVMYVSVTQVAGGSGTTVDVTVASGSC